MIIVVKICKMHRDSLPTKGGIYVYLPHTIGLWCTRRWDIFPLDIGLLLTKVWHTSLSHSGVYMQGTKSDNKSMVHIEVTRCANKNLHHISHYEAFPRYCTYPDVPIDSHVKLKASSNLKTMTVKRCEKTTLWGCWLKKKMGKVWKDGVRICGRSSVFYISWPMATCDRKWIEIQDLSILTSEKKTFYWSWSIGHTGSLMAMTLGKYFTGSNFNMTLALDCCCGIQVNQLSDTIPPQM